MAKFLAAVTIAVLGGAVLCAGPAAADIVDFGTGQSTNTVNTTPWVQNGMTMTPLYDGGTLIAPPPHWSRIGKNFGAGASNDMAEIHRGNQGEVVQFTYGGNLFDLDSIDIDAFSLSGGATSLDVTFTASSGATYDLLSSHALGTLDFTSLGAGWQDITSFTMSVPLGDYACGTAYPQNDCSGLVFDNVVFTPDRVAGAVPEPMSVALFGAGLLGAAAARRRRKTA